MNTSQGWLKPPVPVGWAGRVAQLGRGAVLAGHWGEAPDGATRPRQEPGRPNTCSRPILTAPGRREGKPMGERPMGAERGPETRVPGSQGPAPRRDRPLRGPASAAVCDCLGRPSQHRRFRSRFSRPGCPRFAPGKQAKDRCRGDHGTQTRGRRGQEPGLGEPAPLPGSTPARPLACGGQRGRRGRQGQRRGPSRVRGVSRKSWLSAPALPPAGLHLGDPGATSPENWMCGRPPQPTQPPYTSSPWDTGVSGRVCKQLEGCNV